MSELSHQNAPRKNPFWTYRDPHSGRWVTLMTSAQWQQVSNHAFAPKTRQVSSTEVSWPPESDIPAS